VVCEFILKPADAVPPGAMGIAGQFNRRCFGFIGFVLKLVFLALIGAMVDNPPCG